MRNKIILTIITAILLAIICALSLITKNDTKVFNIEESQQETVASEESETAKDTKEISEQKIEKQLNKPAIPTPKTIKSETKLEIQPTEENVVQEGSIVEEIIDHGIRRNSDGTYEITREFKIKSPTKYSFVNFGFLEKVTK